ncbi:MAG TPA: M1 family aminopeptidase [Gemmatimonadales bacterium]|nr:M1 family aminopeptidase [Gemmatimonadales bacterium]
MHALVPLLLALTAVQTPYDTVYDQIQNLQPKSVAPVKHLVLRRDVLALRLDSGWVYRLTPVHERTVAIAFVGTGSLTFVPPLTVEQTSLLRVLGDSVLNEPITAAVLLFTDSTDAELTRALTFVPRSSVGNIPDPGGAIDDARDYLVDGHTHSVEASFLAPILNSTTTEFFSAYVRRARGESVMMEFDPNEQEEVILNRRGKMLNQRIETICQFQRLSDLDRNVAITSKDQGPLLVDAYHIDATIGGSYSFKAIVDARVRVRRDRQQWIPLRLYRELDVDSVTTPAGTPLTYYRHGQATPLWVQLDKPIGPGDTSHIRVVYHGSVIGFGSAIEEFLPPFWDERRRALLPILDQWAFIKETETWYPRYNFEPATVALTFHTPKSMRLATIGRLVSADTTGDVVRTEWVSELPTDQVSFNIGKFDEWVLRDPRIPPVTVQVNSDAHRVLDRLFLGSRNPGDQVGADIVNSLSFFSKMYGPPLFHQYFATEIPYFHGQAFPGMIHLSWWTFLSRSEKGHDEQFRAHEMAHQWWGIGVEPANYRDAWLAEGFAEFSGMWYMQLILHDNDKYFKMLHDARQEIRRAREKSAPIGLGYRAAENWRGAYALTTYQKGAWVLHMLRNLLLDTHTMSEDRFFNMMHDFYMTYRGKRASTTDFQRAVEKAVGLPMDWFFNEWVYGTAMPTYTFSWTSEPDSSGTGVVARLRVRQSDVPDDFAMYVPALIKFDQGEALVRMLVRGPASEIKIRLPARPASVELNPLESVLAEVKTEGWHQ